MAKHTDFKKNIFANLTCSVCEAPRNRYAYLCPRCKKLVDKAHRRYSVNRDIASNALKSAWDRNKKVFRCYYTGVTLVENNHRDPRYFTFDHRTPRDERDIVVASACINDMKSDLSEKEFRRIVLELAQRFQGGPFDECVLNLAHWKR
jgi:hypothetical protein